jgi:DNA invertase Pin-like site-specific DNA recombinase
LIFERERDGIAVAKSEGKYLGRKPTAQAKADDVKALHAEGLSMGHIAERLGIGKGSVHRILKAH